MRSTRKRLVGGLGAAAALTLLVLLVVLPALGSTGVPPASTDGVTPTQFTLPSVDGTACTKSFYPNGGAPAYAFYIKDVKSKTYTDPATGATFTVTVNPPNTGGPSSGKWPYYATNRYLSFTSTGAQIVDVGVDGANEKTGTHYSYAGQPGGTVTSDGYLHATLVTDKHGNPTGLDELDDLEVCYGHLTSQTVSVFNDANHNGTQDGGESLISSPNWTLDLYDGSGNPVGSPVTTSGGSYTFQNLTAGSHYKVCIVGQSTWTQTVPTGTANCTGAENGVGYSFTAGAGTPTKFGEVQQGSISGTAYTDPNGNDTNTSPIGGLTVTLYSGSTAVATTTTAGDGTYGFTNAYVGSYTLCITAPGGNTTQTVPGSGATCSTEGTTGYSLSLTASGATGKDFGFEPWGSVSGTVYHDVNQNGQNDDSAPQAGWTVTLYDNGDPVGSPITTDTSGAYSFDGVLQPGQQYTVCEQPPSDDNTWVQTEPLPSSEDVCQTLGTGNLDKGYVVSDSDSGWPSFTDDDFGNTVAQATCPPGGGSVSFGNDKLETCKPNQTYSFDSGTLQDGDPWVSVFAGDQSSGELLATLEDITLPDPIDPTTHQAQFTKLQYTDTFPYDPANLKPMGYCDGTPADPSLPAGETSCLVNSQVTLDNGGTFEATIFTKLDGFRAGFG